MSRTWIAFEVLQGDDTREVKFTGREAETLLQLMDAGERGVSSLTHPGIRLSHYVMKLRRAGVNIETNMRPFGGAFPGEYGAYILRSKCRVLGAPQRRAA